jgi:hypothetical protein
MKPASAFVRPPASLARALTLLPAGFLLTTPLLAGQREVLSGNVTPAPGAAKYDYLFQYRPNADPAAAFISELDYPAILKTFPNQRFEVMRDVFVAVGGGDERIPVWPRYTDRGTALRLLPSELLAPWGEPLSPERWAGANTGLHPTLHENQPFEVTGPADYDGDGITDDVDAFPADPGETADNDLDGTGNNADPDDDNDLMSDTYESANNLDPFADDAGMDPDGDGFTNAEESAAGTAARDGKSSFRIETAAHPNPDQITLTWLALPGRRYEVWHRPKLESRGSRLQQDLRVTAPGPLSATFAAQPAGDFYFILVIADPF